MQETWVWSLGWEEPLEREIATHSSILAWKIQWAEKPGRLQSLGSKIAGHNLVTKQKLWQNLVYHNKSRQASLGAQLVKHLPAVQETWVQFLGWKDPLEKEIATHSSILAWRIPWTEEPGGVQSMGSQRVGLDWATNSFTSLWHCFHFLSINCLTFLNFPVGFQILKTIPKRRYSVQILLDSPSPSLHSVASKY